MAESREDFVRLEHVPADQRQLIRTFVNGSEAMLAAGFLRAQGIAAELSPNTIPGLEFETALYVHQEQAVMASKLLDEADDYEFDGDHERSA